MSVGWRDDCQPERVLQYSIDSSSKSAQSETKLGLIAFTIGQRAVTKRIRRVSGGRHCGIGICFHTSVESQSAVRRALSPVCTLTVQSAMPSSTLSILVCVRARIILPVNRE